MSPRGGKSGFSYVVLIMIAVGKVVVVVAVAVIVVFFLHFLSAARGDFGRGCGNIVN